MIVLELVGAQAGTSTLLGKLLLLLGLGVVMASSPTTVGMEVTVLGTRTGAVRRVGVIVGVIWLVSLLLALLLSLVSPATLHALWTGRVEPVVAQRRLDVAVGLALVVLGAWRWRGARRPRKAPVPDFGSRAWSRR